MAELMIYGAYGYTGELISRKAKDAGLAPILAGRDGTRLNALAGELALAAKTFDLRHPAKIQDALRGVKVLLNCAGPFAQTAAPMREACLQCGTDYLDITGELPVLEATATLDQRAKAAGVTLMPGVGFDVVPTDCMAALLKERMPDATALTLAFGGIERASRGTTRTSVMFLPDPVKVRVDGHITPRKGPGTAMIDLGEGPRLTFATTWGDVVTAFHTTGIPNIEVFFDPSEDVIRILKMPRLMKRVLASPLGRPILNLHLRTMPPGPTAEERRSGRAHIYGKATNSAGEAVELRLETAEPYELTSRTAVAIARRVLAGEAEPGFQTPAGTFGADFILGIDGSALKS